MKPRYKPLSIRRQERKYRSKLFISISLALVLAFVMINWLLPFLIGGLSFVNKLKAGEVKNTKAEDASLAPPVLSIPYEATSSASIRVKGYTQPYQKVEIYLGEDVADTVEANEEGQFLSSEVDLTLGSNSIYGKTIDDGNHSSLPSKAIRIIFDNEKPELEVTEPQDGSISKDKKIKVSGKVDYQDTTILTVNNTRVIFSSDGNFSQTIELNDGENTITISASDLAGNDAKQVKKVTYQP